MNKNILLKKLIKEAISDRLKMIDEAGDKAAIQAKIAKLEEEIREAQQIKSSIHPNMNHYVSSEIINDMREELDESIRELETRKKELENSISKVEKANSKAAKEKKN
jgi:soluble cytochrome b562